MNVEWQGRIAVGFVALAAMLVAGHYLKKPLGGRLARGLLKRGHVKWAMRMRKFSGDRDCC